MKKLILSNEYKNWLKGIKERIAISRIKASLSANYELISLYWFLGSQIVKKQKTANWGSSFIDQFSKDLKKEFSEIGGFSRTNLYYIKKFYEYFSTFKISEEIIPQVEGQIKNKKQ